MLLSNNMIRKGNSFAIAVPFCMPVRDSSSVILTGFLYEGGDCMLTSKQEKFCLEYAKCGNARQAYIKAGYKHKKDSTTDAAASRLLSNVKVKDRLAELAEEAKTDAIADIQEMQETLTRIIRQSMTEEVIVVEGCGEGCSSAVKMEKTPAIKDVISAIEKLGKMQGAFKEKIEVEAVIPVFSGEDDLEE